MNRSLNENHEAEKRLDIALEAIRDQTVPPFPKSELNWDSKLRNDTHRAIPAGTTSIIAGDNRQTGERVGVPWGLSLVASCAVAVLIGVVVFWPGATQTAFAQVQQAIKEVKTVRYSVFHLHRNKTYLTKVTIQEPNLSRSESEHDGVKISDSERGVRIQIDDRNKTVTVFELNLSEQEKNDLYQYRAALRDIPNHAIKRIGATTFNDKPAEQFLVNRGEREYVVTVDSATKLPVEMKFTKPGYTRLITDFEFDIKVDPELFSQAVPAGYAIIEKKTIKPPSPHRLVEKLVVSATAGLNHLGFESSMQEVIDFLGEPTNKQVRKDVDPIGGVHESTTLYYDNAGLKLFFNSRGLASISCVSNPEVVDFAGQTDNGITLGDPMTKVRDAYGKPEFVFENGVNYLRQGIMFTSRKDIVVGMLFTGPVDPNIQINVGEEGQGWTYKVEPRAGKGNDQPPADPGK